MKAKGAKTISRRNVVRAELEKLADERGGHISPRAVIDAARKPDHQLHPFFEWNDSKAGEAFRLVQASALIREVRLQVVVESSDPMRVTLSVQRAFYSLPSLRGSEKGSYVAAASISDPTELADEVLVQIENLRKKHAALAQLSGVWRAVDEARERIQPQAPERKKRSKRG